jgi:hypothetical protein
VSGNQEAAGAHWRLRWQKGARTLVRHRRGHDNVVMGCGACPPTGWGRPEVVGGRVPRVPRTRTKTWRPREKRPCSDRGMVKATSLDSIAHRGARKEKFYETPSPRNLSGHEPPNDAKRNHKKPHDRTTAGCGTLWRRRTAEATPSVCLANLCVGLARLASFRFPSLRVAAPLCDSRARLAPLRCEAKRLETKQTKPNEGMRAPI